MIPSIKLITPSSPCASSTRLTKITNGVSILIAVVVVVTVSSVTDWKKEHQFKDLSDEQKKKQSLVLLEMELRLICKLMIY
jgi:hypothetical protein